MKNIIVLMFGLMSLAACKTKAGAENVDTLPKDISLKPENNITQQQEQEQLKLAMKEIDSLIKTEDCPNPADWTFTAIGSKPCGGPSSYIAYPKKLAMDLLPKVNNLTAMQDAFNKKYRLMSDCALVLPPTEIICEEGRVILVNGNSSVAQIK